MSGIGKKRNKKEISRACKKALKFEVNISTMSKLQQIENFPNNDNNVFVKKEPVSQDYFQDATLELKKETKVETNDESKAKKFQVNISPTLAELEEIVNSPIDNVFVKKEPVSQDYFQEATLEFKKEVKIEPNDELNAAASTSTEPVEVFVKGVYLTKERTKWMEVHHDVRSPRTIKMIKIAGYTYYREKYQEVLFDLKRWNELYHQKDVVEEYLNEDGSFVKVGTVKLSGNIKVELKNENIGKFVTFSQNRNKVSMKGFTFSYMMKYNAWVQDCLAIQEPNF